MIPTKVDFERGARCPYCGLSSVLYVETKYYRHRICYKCLKIIKFSPRSNYGWTRDIQLDENFMIYDIFIHIMVDKIKGHTI